MRKCIAGSDISTGVAVKNAGKKWIYSGKIFNPLTWFKFENVYIVELCHVDHSAILKVKSVDGRHVKIDLS